MKLAIVLVVLLGVAFADEKFSTEHDNFDVEALVASADKLKEITECFIDRSPCNEVYAHFKKDVPEAIQKSCGKCTDAQKHILKRYLEALNEKLPEHYAAFKAKYDPESKFFTPLEEAVKNY